MIGLTQVNGASELWRDVPGCEGRYQVSSDGRVMSFVRRPAGQILKLDLNVRRGGYLQVCLSVSPGKKKVFRVHRLVLQAFTGRSGDGLEACHLNHVRTDNRLSNLEWGTSKDNSRQMIEADRHNRGERNGRSRIGAGQAMAIYLSDKPHREIARSLGVSRSLVGMIKSGARWSSVTGSTPIGGGS